MKSLTSALCHAPTQSMSMEQVDNNTSALHHVPTQSMSMEQVDNNTSALRHVPTQSMSMEEVDNNIFYSMHCQCTTIHVTVQVYVASSVKAYCHCCVDS